MGGPAKKPVVVGTGPDNPPYAVKQFGKTTKQGAKYNIYFGHAQRSSMRFPAGKELTHEVAYAALAKKLNTSAAHGHPPGYLGRPPPMLGAAAASEVARPSSLETVVVSEGDAFVGNLGPTKRRKIEPSRLEVEGRAPRDYEQERRTTQTNNLELLKKRAAEEALGSENKRLHSEIDELQRQLDDFDAEVVGRYAQMATEAVMENLGGIDEKSSGDVYTFILDYVETALGEKLDTITEGEKDCGDYEEKAGGGRMSALAHQRGLTMTKKGYAALRKKEMLQNLRIQQAEADLATALSTVNSRVHQRDLTINKLQKTIRGLKEKVHTHMIQTRPRTTLLRCVAQHSVTHAHAHAQVPGGLASWRVQTAEPPPPDYPRSTRKDHLDKLSELLMRITNFDSSKQMWLTAALRGRHQTSGAATKAEVDSERLTLCKNHVWSALVSALGSLKNTTGSQGGRIDNHRRVVRQILLTILASDIPAKLRATAADNLGVYARDLREYSSVLSEILSGERETWYQLRAKTKSKGRFAKTSVEDLEAAHAHWLARWFVNQIKYFI